MFILRRICELCISLVEYFQYRKYPSYYIHDVKVIVVPVTRELDIPDSSRGGYKGPDNLEDGVIFSPYVKL